MRILLTNTLMLNGGEAATVYAIRGLLRQAFGPAAEVTVYESAAPAAARYFPDIPFRQLVHDRICGAPRVPVVGRLLNGCSRARFRSGATLWRDGRRRLARLALTRADVADLEHYAAADLVVSTGGTYLVGNYDIAPRLFDYELCLKLGKPLVFFTQSMGPFRPATRGRLRNVLNRAALILLRDEPSRQHLRELGVCNPSIQLCGDAAFALDAESAAAVRPRPGARPRVAVSVRHWHYFRTMAAPVGMACYRAGIAAAVTRLVREHAAEIVFLSTCQGVPEYWFDDAAVGRELAAALPADVRPHVSVDAAFRRPDEMLAALRGYDMVIATRFHMAILAMLVGTPAVAISYEFKTHELYRGVGLADWVDDIEPLHERAFAERVERCFMQREAARPAFARAAASERERALRAVELLRAAYAATGAAPAMAPGSRPAAVRPRDASATAELAECTER